MHWHRVLAAVDQSPGGAQALRSAAALATATGGALVAVTVAEQGRDTTPGRIRHEITALIQATLGPVDVTSYVDYGLPAVEIARRAESERADVLIMGRGADGGRSVGRIGPVLEGTIRRARLPVLTVPVGQRGLHRVLAAVSGGPESGVVLDAATTLAAALDGEVIALRVTPSGPVPDRWANPPTSTAIPVALLERMGDPAAEILRAAQEHAVDVIVLGHHYGNPLAEVDTKSVAGRVLRRAPTAVLTVPV
jgi:nucleotide-binding universal stress UspA family protein